MNKLIGVLSAMALIVVLLSVATWYLTKQMNMKDVDHMNTVNEITKEDMNNQVDLDAGAETIDKLTTDKETIVLIQPKEGQPVKEFSLVAKESILELKAGFTMAVWSYGDTVPGTEIRVTEGDFVRVYLKNELNEPITIHWHGYPVLSAMDGIPGFTQDAVLPGETFTYEFNADYTGTYWYHSHQESSKQVDKGLYGALIVMPQEQTQIDKDFTFILDEWMEKPEESMDMSIDSADEGMIGMEGMPGTSADPVTAEDEMMSTLYNIYTVNGKSGEIINPLEVEKGDVVRLRFINAGYRSHGIHIPGQDVKVVSTDGQDIKGASAIKDQVILIAPGERYDVEFTVQSEDNFVIDAHDNNLFSDQIKIPVTVTNGSGNWMTETLSSNFTLFDLKDYGAEGNSEFNLDQAYDIDQVVELDTDIKDGTVRYTINGKVYGELPPLSLQTGHLIKLTYDNKSTVDHPMHLHGHFFQVLTKNDEAFSGAAILKDTLLIKPGEKYVVAFKADNPGIWVQHCHELHHAAGGMMQKVIYTDYVSNYIPNPKNTFNKAE